LNQIPAISSQANGGSVLESHSGTHASARSEFLDSARGITASQAPSPLGEDLEAARSPTTSAGNTTEGIEACDEEAPESDSELGALLAAIADEVQDGAAAARGAIMADFGARIAHARKYLRGHQRVAALGALKEGRKAALALVKRNAAQELAGRKRAAIAARRRRPHAAKSARKPSR
jgi:hypothetical protein